MNDGAAPLPIVELAGLPAAGKTTTAQLLATALRERGLASVIVPEAAEAAPLAEFKRAWLYNAWTLSATVSNYLGCHGSGDDSLAILDRGFADSLCWIMWHRMQGRIDPAVADALEAFASVPAWFDRTQLIVLLRCQPATSILRRGGTGKIVNTDTLLELTQAYARVIGHLQTCRGDQSVVIVDTDALAPDEVVERVLARIQFTRPQTPGT